MTLFADVEYDGLEADDEWGRRFTQGGIPVLNLPPGVTQGPNEWGQNTFFYNGRQMRAHYSLEAAQDLQAFHGIDVLQTIYDLLEIEIAAEIAGYPELNQ